MQRVARRWVDHVGGEEDNDHNEGVDPSVAEGKIFPSAEEATRFSTLGMRA